MDLGIRWSVIQPYLVFYVSDIFQYIQYIKNVLKHLFGD